jgi:hypothetical protein
MDTINVLVVSKIIPEYLRQIAEVSPRIKVIPAFHLWNASGMVTAETRLTARTLHSTNYYLRPM